MDEEKKHASLKVIMILIMVVIAFSGWGFAVNLYEELNVVEGRFQAGVARTGISAIVAFTINAIAAIPHAAEIISATLKQRIWLPIAVVVVEVGALLFWAWAKKFEEEIYGDASRRKKAKKR